MAGNSLALSERQEVITQFQTELEILSSKDIHVLPDLTAHINHDGTPTLPQPDLPAGLLVAPSLLDPQKSVSRPDALTFLVQPANRMGRETSHNHVFFGKLLMHHFDEQASSREAQIAIKPMKTKDRAVLLGELAMLQYMNGLQIPTYRPDALLNPQTTEHHHLLTHFNRPIDTMDTIEWEDMDPQEMWGQVGFAIDTLAILHSHLLFHGDFEFKNVGFGETGEAFVVDPEFMKSVLELGVIAAHHKGDSEEAARAIMLISKRMSEDFTNLCRSVNEFILSRVEETGRPKSDIAKFKAYSRHIYKPYRAALVDLGSPHLPVLVQAYEAMIHQKKTMARQNSLPA